MDEEILRLINELQKKNKNMYKNFFDKIATIRNEIIEKKRTTISIVDLKTQIDILKLQLKNRSHYFNIETIAQIKKVIEAFESRLVMMELMEE